MKLVREKKQKQQQISFWGSHDLYAEFVNVVKSHDLMISDVFRQLMERLIDENAKGKIEIVESEQRRSNPERCVD